MTLDWSDLLPEPPAGEPRVTTSARQQQVAELVATGMTNRQIGEELGISPYTVKIHLHAFMGNNQLPNRAAVAAVIQRDTPIPVQRTELPTRAMRRVMNVERTALLLAAVRHALGAVNVGRYGEAAAVLERALEP